MTTNSKEQLITDYVREKIAGKDYSTIRAELTQKGFDDPEIKELISEIDEVLLKEEMNKSVLLKKTELKSIGIVLIVLGLFVTIGSFTGLIPMPGYFTILVGPITVGAFILFGIRNLRKSNRVSDKRDFRR